MLLIYLIQLSVLNCCQSKEWPLIGRMHPISFTFVEILTACSCAGLRKGLPASRWPTCVTVGFCYASGRGYFIIALAEQLLQLLLLLRQMATLGLKLWRTGLASPITMGLTCRPFGHWPFGSVCFELVAALFAILPFW